MTVYIEVQQVDYDDYPQGKPRNIGPFDSKEEAEAYMARSPRFVKTNLYGYEHWTLAGGAGFGNRSTVYVFPMEVLFVGPDEYDERGW